MRVLSLLGLLLVAARPTRSVATEPGHGWDEQLGSGQANAAPTIASSTFSDTISPSQELAMLHDKTQGTSSSAFDFGNINRVDQLGESSSINEWHSSPGSKIDASHIRIDFKQLRQKGETLDCLIDLNRIPIDSEMFPSKDFLENLVPDNTNAHQFGDSSSMNEWHSSPHISIGSQPLNKERENLDCLIDLNRIPIDSEILPSQDFLDNLVPDNTNAYQFGDSSSRNLAVQSMFKLYLGLLSSCEDWTPSTSSNRDASRINIDEQSIESVEGKTFDCRIENTINSKNQPVEVRKNFVPNEFPQQTHKMVQFRTAKSLLGLRMLCQRLNWDLDEVKDYDSLCVFLVRTQGKSANPKQVEFHNSVAMTEHMMEQLLRGKSGRDNVEVGQNNIDIPDPGLLTKATNTLQKLIQISNFVLKLVSFRKSRSRFSHKLIKYLKNTCIPVLQCLVICCGKDMDLFQKRWGTHFKHRDFGVNCCPGRGSNHPTCGFQMTKIVRNPDNRDTDSSLLNLKALNHAVSTSKTAEEKLKLCCEFNEIYRLSGAVARKLLRSYYSRSAKPIWGCFVHHCGQNINEWIRKWGPRFSHGQFGRRKCQGLKFHDRGRDERPFDIPSRRSLRRKSTRDLLPAVSGMLKKYDQFVIAKTPTMRSPHPALTNLIRRCLRPVNHCLHRHCAGSVEKFVRRWGESVSYTKFSRDCCPGTGTEESDICQYNSRSSQG